MKAGSSNPIDRKLLTVGNLDERAREVQYLAEMVWEFGSICMRQGQHAETDTVVTDQLELTKDHRVVSREGTLRWLPFFEI